MQKLQSTARKVVERLSRPLRELRFVANHIYLLGAMLKDPSSESAYDPKTWKCGRCGSTLYRNGTCPNCDYRRDY